MCIILASRRRNASGWRGIYLLRVGGALDDPPDRPQYKPSYIFRRAERWSGTLGDGGRVEDRDR